MGLRHPTELRAKGRYAALAAGCEGCQVRNAPGAEPSAQNAFVMRNKANSPGSWGTGKSETRNAKFETNPKHERENAQNGGARRQWRLGFGFGSLGLVSSFGIRISCFRQNAGDMRNKANLLGRREAGGNRHGHGSRHGLRGTKDG